MKPMNPKVKKGLKITGDVFFWVFFALMLSITVFSFASRSSAAGYPKFGDTALFAIRSDSMENSTYEDGGFKKGDLIISKVLTTNEEKKDLKVGDVITFVDPNLHDLNTHRIVEVTPVEGSRNLFKYKTKGDNTPAVDNFTISSGDVEAVWTGKRVAAVGAIMNFLNEPYGFWPCIVLPLTGLLGYEIYKLVKVVQAERGDTGKRKITKADEELIKQKAIEEYLAKQKAEEEQKKAEAVEPVKAEPEAPKAEEKAAKKAAPKKTQSK